MQQGEFEMLVLADASLRVELDMHPDRGWLIFVFFPSADVGTSIKTARGTIRVWKNLDTAYQWIRARGWTGDIRILAP